MAHAGALATLTAEEYPGLTDFFVQVWEGSSDDSKVIFRAYGNSPEEARTRADLGADALNVHGATGLTPPQLQARVAELEAALREGMETLDAMGDMPDRLIHPDAWRKLNCEKKIAEFRRMLGEA